MKLWLESKLELGSGFRVRGALNIGLGLLFLVNEGNQLCAGLRLGLR